MELALNIVWLCAAVGLVGLWRGQRRRAGAEPIRDPIRELVAIAALILFLFPVISVTDDLQIAQNVSETDTVLRRGCSGAEPHSIFPAFPFLPEAVQQQWTPAQLSELARIMPERAFAPAIAIHAGLFNRPPPAA